MKLKPWMNDNWIQPIRKDVTPHSSISQTINSRSCSGTLFFPVERCSRYRHRHSKVVDSKGSFKSCQKTGWNHVKMIWYKTDLDRSIKILNFNLIIFLSHCHSISPLQGGEGVKAENHLQDMRRRNIAPTVSSFNTVIHACARVGASREAEKYLLEMKLGWLF